MKIKEIVESEKANFAFPSQSIYIESMPQDKTEFFKSPKVK